MGTILKIQISIIIIMIMMIIIIIIITMGKPSDAVGFHDMKVGSTAFSKLAISVNVSA